MECGHLNLKLYLFGSALILDEPNDIDILILFSPKIYKDYRKIISIRNYLYNYISTYTRIKADIIILTFDEEYDLDYINQTKAIRVI